MNFKKINQMLFGVLLISPIISTFELQQYNQKELKKNVRAIDWDTIDIIDANTNFDTENNKWNIFITLGIFEEGTTAVDVLAEINSLEKLGIYFKVNDEANINGDFGQIGLMEDNIEINADNSATVTLSLDLPPDIQIIYETKVSKDYDGANWENWVELKGAPIINKIDTNLISLDDTKNITQSNVTDTKASIMVPIKYDDTQIVAGVNSSTVIEANLENMTIKSNDEMLMIDTISVQLTTDTLRAEVSNLETTINLVDLNYDTEYTNLVIDLDGDETTTDDIMELNDFSFKTALQNEKLTPLEISSIVIMSLLIIGIFIFIFLIIYQNLLKKQDK